jgi:hypothetical protein
MVHHGRKCEFSNLLPLPAHVRNEAGFLNQPIGFDSRVCDVKICDWCGEPDPWGVSVIRNYRTTIHNLVTGEVRREEILNVQKLDFCSEKCADIYLHHP